MTPGYLDNIIQLDIEKNIINNWHGINKENISKFLVPPHLKKYVSGNDLQLKQYWLVLDEAPQDQINGYQIIFDEQDEEFGLAAKSNLIGADMSIGIVIGFYGSFVDTINNM